MTYRQFYWERRGILQPFEQLLGAFSADERAVLLGAVGHGQVPPAFLVRLAAARQRASSRSESDAKTDHARRILVGARLPRQTAERYRECAAAHGLSLYRFVANALEREYWRLKERDTGGIL